MSDFQLELKIKKSNSRATYKPAEEFSVIVNGDPGATVGLVVVDKAAYALSKEGILTQHKVTQGLFSFYFAG